MFSKVITVMQIIFFLLGANIALAKSDKKDTEQHPNSYYFRQFQEVFQRIEKDYMQEPERQEMTDEAINGMLRSLDPYSGYYTGEDLAFFLDQTDLVLNYLLPKLTILHQEFLSRVLLEETLHSVQRIL